VIWQMSKNKIFTYVMIAAEGSTPNLDMKVLRSSLDPVFRADLCIVETISCVCPYLRCRNSGGAPGGVREKY
jgi:hypothetical protein